MQTLTEENYLKSIFLLTNPENEVSVNQLSQQLSIKKPTVTSMMKKLSQKGLIKYESYKPIRLTEKGRRVAMEVIRRHRLTEMFLVEKMGFGWEMVHDIAEQIEHVDAPELFNKMDEMLGYPVVDPHGSPIPDRNGRLKSLNYLHVSDCKVGDTLKIAAVIHTSNEFLSYLNKYNLRMKVIFKIISKENFDHSMRIRLKSKEEISISKEVAERILVERI